MTVPAMIAPQSVARSWLTRKKRIPICAVLIDSSLVITSGHKNWFQALRKAKIVNAEIAPFDSGTTTRHR